MTRFLVLVLALVAATLCSARAPVVRVGLPQLPSYETVQRKLAAERCSDKASVCYRYALGSEYQLLDWLQTGRIDAAAVSGLTLEVMRQAVGEKKFADEFFVSTKLPASEVAPWRYRIVLSAERNGAALPDPEAELHTLLRDLIAGPRSDAVVDLPSHLSAGVPDLHRRLRASLKVEPGASEQRGLDAVMANLVGSLRFADGRAGPPLRFLLAEQDGGPLSHFFLVRKVSLPLPLDPGASVAPTLDDEKHFLDYLKGAGERAAPSSGLGRFAAGNYKRNSAGWRNRFSFAFSLDELHGILRSHARDAQEDKGIALVLTGGGVKAAYQTKLIDHLYGGGGYLHNRLGGGTPKAHAVPVDYVVGTSGGALLGIFVASVDGGNEKLDLSTKLWHRHDKNGKATDKRLSASNVFPWADLMRWASVLLCVTIFGLVCAATALLRRWLGNTAEGERDQAGRFWRFTVWWLALLGATPWLLVYLNGEHGAEHIPAIQGAFYGLFVLIAVYSDNRIVTRKESRTGIASPRWPMALAATGCALVALALLLARGESRPIESLGSSITVPALIACFGAACVFWGLHRWFIRCAPRLEPVKSRALAVIALMIGVFVVSHGILCVLALLGYASTFELILLEFWGVLAAIAAAVSVVLAGLAYSGGAPRLRQLFDFMLAPHPSLNVVNVTRGTRMVACAVAGWLWWNLLVAPGLYGNDDAQRYFRQAAINVFGEQAVGAGNSPSLAVKFHAYYVAPVTALQKGGERYVMFRPAQAYALGASGAGLGSRSWVTISNDPRWLTVEDEEQQARLVMPVAFASGSPFPVFPAHRIHLPVIGEELLVDGGYAHNVPVEAAKRLGARRVLVIHSSPREPGTSEPAAKPAAGGSDFQVLGNFALMLRSVVPYLYNRSQVEDALSGEDLLLASIAPSASPKGWPFLTDFRAEVIKRMFDEAEKDRKLRIGSIENWGQPSFAARPTSGIPARGSPSP